MFLFISDQFSKYCQKNSPQNLSAKFENMPILMHKNDHIFKFCQKILRNNFFMILVNSGSNDQLLIETLGIETIFCNIEAHFITVHPIIPNQPFPANMRQNQAFWATVRSSHLRKYIGSRPIWNIRPADDTGKNGFRTWPRLHLHWIRGLEIK